MSTSVSVCNLASDTCLSMCHDACVPGLNTYATRSTRTLENTYLRTLHSSNTKHHDASLAARLGVGDCSYGDGIRKLHLGRQRRHGARPMQRRRMRASVGTAAYLHRPPTVAADADLPGRHADAMSAGAGRLLRRRSEHASAAVLPSTSYRLHALLQQLGFAYGSTACCRLLLRDCSMSRMAGCGVVAV